MLVEMADFGDNLVTRAAGRKAFEEIVARTGRLEGHTTFDFAGVDCITTAFADEVFGRLVQDFGFDGFKSRTSFANISRFWAQVVRAVIDNRARDATNRA